MRFNCRSSLLFISIYLLFFGAACKKRPPRPPPPPPPLAAPRLPARPTASLTAEPSSIERGTSVRLKWSSTNATNASLNHGIGPVRVSGSREVLPTETTSYTLTVKGQGGEASAAATVTVRVPSPPPPPPPPPPPERAPAFILQSRARERPPSVPIEVRGHRAVEFPPTAGVVAMAVVVAGPVSLGKDACLDKWGSSRKAFGHLHEGVLCIYDKDPRGSMGFDETEIITAKLMTADDDYLPAGCAEVKWCGKMSLKLIASSAFKSIPRFGTNAPTVISPPYGLSIHEWKWTLETNPEYSGYHTPNINLTSTHKLEVKLSPVLDTAGGAYDQPPAEAEIDVVISALDKAHLVATKTAWGWVAGLLVGSPLIPCVFGRGGSSSKSD